MQSRPSEQPHGRTTPLHVRVLRTLEDDHVRRPMRWAMRVLLALALAVAVFWQGGASIWALKLEGALVGLALVVAVATRARTTLRVRAALPWLARCRLDASRGDFSGGKHLCAGHNDRGCPACQCGRVG